MGSEYPLVRVLPKYPLPPSLSPFNNTYQETAHLRKGLLLWKIHFEAGRFWKFVFLLDGGGLI